MVNEMANEMADEMADLNLRTARARIDLIAVAMTDLSGVYPLVRFSKVFFGCLLGKIFSRKLVCVYFVKFSSLKTSFAFDSFKVVFLHHFIG